MGRPIEIYGDDGIVATAGPVPDRAYALQPGAMSNSPVGRID